LILFCPASAVLVILNYLQLKIRCAAIVFLIFKSQPKTDYKESLIENFQIKNSFQNFIHLLFLRKIKNFNIKSYECKVKSVKIDPTTKTWAFVEYETVAKLGDGKKMSVGTLSVLQKIGGNWKLLAGIKTQGSVGAGPKNASPSALPGKTDAQSAKPSESVPGVQ